MPEPRFVPKPGQVDYTDVRYAPVVNIVVTKDGKVLLVKRAQYMRFYPGYWATIDGFLDDSKSIEDKTLEELEEELGINQADIIILKRGKPIVFDAPEYKKTWLIIPVLVKIKTDEFKINDESKEARWFKLNEIAKLNLLPNNQTIIKQFLN